MATGTLTPADYRTEIDANGAPISGALIYTYMAGTSTPVATYTDVNLLVANANPIVADSSGRWVAFLSPGASYKYVHQTALGVTYRTQDNISAVPNVSGSTDITGTAGAALAAGDVVYLSNGSGGKVAGQWYDGDATNTYSSTLPLVGMVPSAIASGAVGTIRIGGQVTGLSGLIVGTSYYVSGTTPGALTSTAPSNARFVGVADTISSIDIAPNPPNVATTIDNTICDFRLTLTSATPVTTADVTAAVNIYLTPYKGNRIALYDGTSWNIRTSAELTQALGTLTTALPYDVFCYDNGGTPATEILAWTSTTARATALTLQDGVLVKTGATTRRYLGTFYTTSTTTTEDSALKRDLWNYYNRVPRPMTRVETTGSWAYTTATWRQANASTSNQLEVVVGVAEVLVDVWVVAVGAAATSVSFNVGIGEDSTTTPLTGVLGQTSSATSGTNVGLTFAHVNKYPAVGYHKYCWLEIGDGANATTFRSAANVGQAQSGMTLIIAA